MGENVRLRRGGDRDRSVELAKKIPDSPFASLPFPSSSVRLPLVKSVPYFGVESRGSTRRPRPGL